MRWALAIVLIGGCASTAALETATANAQGCEQARAQAQADADRGVPNAQAWADRIAVDCRAWRDQVAIEQARIDTDHTNRMAASAALQGFANAQQTAHSGEPDPPTYRCERDLIPGGGMTCRPR